MPRPRFGNWLVQAAIVIPANGFYDVLVDQIDTFYPQYLINAVWPKTGGTTGLACEIFRGYLLNGQTQWSDLADSVTIGSQPTISTTNQTTNNDFNVDAEAYPRFIKFRITNLDVSYPVTVTVVGDR